MGTSLQKGSHVQLKDPGRPGRVTVPMHGGETIGPKLLRSILTQAGIIETHIAGLKADGEAVPTEVGAPQLLAVTVAA